MSDLTLKRIARLELRIEASRRRMQEMIAARLDTLDRVSKLAAKVLRNG